MGTMLTRSLVKQLLHGMMTIDAHTFCRFAGQMISNAFCVFRLPQAWAADKESGRLVHAADVYRPAISAAPTPVKDAWTRRQEHAAHICPQRSTMLR